MLNKALNPVVEVVVVVPVFPMGRIKGGTNAEDDVSDPLMAFFPNTGIKLLLCVWDGDGGRRFKKGPLLVRGVLLEVDTALVLPPL